jgi:hypothetical protein
MESYNYQEKKKEEEKINVNVKFEGKNHPFICNINEKVKKIMDEFSKKIGLPQNSLSFLSTGRKLKGEETFSQLKDNIVINDGQPPEITIVVVRKSDNNN